MGLSLKKLALVCVSFFLVAVPLAVAVPPAAAKPVYFPPTADGYPGEVRDERDVAPYLAFHKARAMAKAKALEAAGQTVATPNQNAWDAKYYSLDLAFAPSTSTVSGTVLVRAQVLAGPISTLDLDFYANMTVDAATSGGAATTWVHTSNILTVNLDHAYATGQTITVTVTYHGTPVTGWFAFSTYNGIPMIWSVSESWGARTWWPCKDYPSDKADSVDVRYTVPTTFITASNGTLISSSDNGTVAVTQWKERHPITTYLVFIASYPYTVSTDTYSPSPGVNMPIRFYNFPDHAASVAPVQAKVKNMLAAYASRFGEYPFIDEKYGHAECLFGGGMEHQTCTSLGAFNEYIVAHELSHQWWGDYITCRDFHHVWLNEGFATYCEALWAESVSGSGAYHDDMNFKKFLGGGSIYVPDETDENRVFDANLSYNKASWVLHMLRHMMGDSTFFAALRQYNARYAYSTAVTEDFRDVCEQVSGMDLHRYFQEWIYGEYFPVYRYSFTGAPAGGGYDVSLTLQQTQSWQLFRMPVDVTVSLTGGGSQTFVVQDSLASQSFTLHVPAAPSAVTIDKDDWILKTIDIPVTDPQFDRGVLLVNGVSWSDYGSEITTAYTNKAFWGNYTIDFWDNFAAPSGGYPSTLPAPLGHGAVPADVLGHYRNVIWAGNNYNGDLVSWYDTSILSYLQAGGNVLLMTRMGDSFLTPPLIDYLGITWANGSSIFDCIQTYAGLTNIPILSGQSYCMVFNTTLTQPDSYLLYKADLYYNPDVGIGVYRRPAAGGTHRYNGGRFVFLSGRPYRWNYSALSTNVMYMLQNFFLEPIDVTGVGEGAGDGRNRRLQFAPATPNPFAASTRLLFTLPAEQRVDMVVVDVAGREVRNLVSDTLPAGPHEIAWDGRDTAGRRVANGIYWARLVSNGMTLSRKVTVYR